MRRPACRCGVVERRSRFRLAKARQRRHNVEGYLLAMNRLDEVVQVRRCRRGVQAALVPTVPASSWTLIEVVQLRRSRVLQHRHHRRSKTRVQGSVS